MTAVPVAAVRRELAARREQVVQCGGCKREPDEQLGNFCLVEAQRFEFEVRRDCEERPEYERRRRHTNTIAPQGNAPAEFLQQRIDQAVSNERERHGDADQVLEQRLVRSREQVVHVRFALQVAGLQELRRVEAEDALAPGNFLEKDVAASDREQGEEPAIARAACRDGDRQYGGGQERKRLRPLADEVLVGCPDVGERILERHQGVRPDDQGEDGHDDNIVGLVAQFAVNQSFRLSQKYACK